MKAQNTHTLTINGKNYALTNEGAHLVEVLLATLGSAPVSEPTPKAHTAVAQPTAEKLPFKKADGTVIYGTAKQIANWTRYREHGDKRTDEQKALGEVIKANKAKEPERTRALEKALGLKPNTLKNTACTADECRALGWKGTRKELKAIKAKIRA